MAKKVKSGNVTALIKHVMKKTDTEIKDIAVIRKKTHSATHVTINNGNMKTSNLIEIMESMNEKTIIKLSDGEEFELTK